MQIALYLFSTSNHNCIAVFPQGVKLLYISFLHQTTTVVLAGVPDSDCFISLFYIKPQQSGAEGEELLDCFISLFYIKPQLRSRQESIDVNCFISLFYIKPQPIMGIGNLIGYCFISLFYIKPQRQEL